MIINAEFYVLLLSKGYIAYICSRRLKRNHYISLSILVVFVLTYLGQSLHVILHHGSENSEKDHCCHHSTHCNGQTENPGENTFNFNTIEETCPICSFHFIDFNAQKIPIVEKREMIFFKDITILQSIQYIFQVIKSYQLRAPPSLV